MKRKMLRCIDPNCSAFEAPIGASKERHGVTPCCRSLWWYDEKGHLAGPRYESLFCEGCRSYVCDIPAADLKTGVQKMPMVWHSRCANPKPRFHPTATKRVDELMYCLHVAVEAIADAQVKRRRIQPKDVDSAFLKAVKHMSIQSVNLADALRDVLMGRSGKFGIKLYPRRKP